MVENRCYDPDCNEEECFNPKHYNYICFDHPVKVSFPFQHMSYAHDSAYRFPFQKSLAHKYIENTLDK